jgi:hypothetical protein
MFDIRGSAQVSDPGLTEPWGPRSGQHRQFTRGSAATAGLASGLAVERANAVQDATRRKARQ